jgi:hypothetical protein
MSWVTLTADDILSGMTEKERNDFAKTSVGVAVPDRLAPILADLVAEIQDAIASRSDNPAPPASNMIPAGFKARAVSIARWRVLITIPQYNPGDSRKLDYENAEKFFSEVASGKRRLRSDAVEGAPAPVASTGRWNSNNKILGRMHPTPPPAGAAEDYANPDSPADRT